VKAMRRESLDTTSEPRMNTNAPTGASLPPVVAVVDVAVLVVGLSISILPAARGGPNQVACAGQRGGGVSFFFFAPAAAAAPRDVKFSCWAGGRGGDRNDR
jgi:hypothetical protein